MKPIDRAVIYFALQIGVIALAAIAVLTLSKLFASRI
jgi:hypothetical protein